MGNAYPTSGHRRELPVRHPFRRTRPGIKRRTSTGCRSSRRTPDCARSSCNCRRWFFETSSISTTPRQSCRSGDRGLIKGAALPDRTAARSIPTPRPRSGSRWSGSRAPAATARLRTRRARRARRCRRRARAEESRESCCLNRMVPNRNSKGPPIEADHRLEIGMRRPGASARVRPPTAATMMPATIGMCR